MAQPITIKSLQQKKQNGEKFTVLTAYDASTARLCEAAGVDMLLVGDSLGMVIQGYETTVPVTMDDIIYHAKAVARGSQRILKMLDMPFMSFSDHRQAIKNAARLMQAGYAEIIKLEYSGHQAELIHELSYNGVPVCAHLGLTPQTVHKLGGYKMLGKEASEAAAILNAAEQLEAAGADLLLLECVPASLGKKVSEAVAIPVIGIGAGPDTDAQVLVVNDILGMSAHTPRFAKNFLAETNSIQAAIENYVNAVKSGEFPPR